MKTLGVLAMAIAAGVLAAAGAGLVLGAWTDTGEVLVGAVMLIQAANLGYMSFEIATGRRVYRYQKRDE